ncbi:MAG: TIR domain-containing protein [Dechloromonas sp.]|nr:MAG: TIR domain-containing protein [Dechloromonas sp.]
MAGIYISCRHADSQQYSGRLSALLGGAFGAGFVVCRGDDPLIGDAAAGELSRQLAGIDIVLVLIGPDWLSASRDGRRCLDDPADRVRSEIALALLAGKRVWPVLLGDAVLPAAESLPADLRGLPGGPVHVLADTSWREDAARLCGALRSYLTPPACQPRWEFFAAIGVLVATLVQADAWIEREAALLAAQADAAAGRKDFAGEWAARVIYGAGASHEERFALRREGDAVYGTASYLGHPRIVEDGRVGDGGRIEFVTRSETTGEARQPQIQRYQGRPSGDGIHFVLETTAGDAAGSSLAFVAWRAPP